MARGSKRELSKKEGEENKKKYLLLYSISSLYIFVFCFF